MYPATARTAPAPSQPPVGPAGSRDLLAAAGRLGLLPEPGLPPWSTATSPGWYRVWAAVSVALIAAFASLATAGSLLASNATGAIESNTAPSLIAVQDLFASVAEANAAATAVFLSGSTGEEDRARRNLYLDALDRSARQTEQVAGLVGDDQRSHEALAVIASSLTTYSGSVEASRQANQTGTPGAEGRLRDAIDLTQTDISSSVAVVTERSQDRLDRETGGGRLVLAAAIAAGAAAVIVLIRLQAGALRRSNRIFSLPLLAATLLVVATLVLLAGGLIGREAALRSARAGGYDSIAATSRLQSSVFELQSQLSLRLVGTTGTGAGIDELMGAIDGDVATIAANADSERERAAATELAARWDRYRDAAGEIVSLAASGETGDAVAAFRGQGLSTFNGVNTTIESVLSDNRTQFSAGVAGAASAGRLLPLYSIVLPVLAALGVVSGVLRRLGDYR